ncbi:MAG: signal peptide peptidase SppA [Bergeyella zoohelcum]|nr:signal peptide peptidase SppA [Bergeyella zoohelcum]
MKSFLKNVFANIVAIMIMGVIFFVFFIFFIAIASMSGDEKTEIKNNSVLVIDSKLQIIDAPTDDREDSFIPQKNPPKKVLIYDVIEAIKAAKNDKNIKGISIEADNLEAGITHFDDLRNALEDFKKSGKFVYSYGNIVSQPSYYLGSVADQYFLHPAGGIELKGLSQQVVFFKDFFDKYGVEMEVIRHGKFKAAVEPYLSNHISPENEEQLSVLLNDIWGKVSTKIAASRKINDTQFKTVVDSLYGIIPQNTIKYGLADKLLQKSEYDDIIRTKLGVEKGEKINKISLASYAETLEEKEEEKEIAVLYASGEIHSGDEYSDIYSEKYIKYIRDLKDDDNVKAVVFRINSPGGSANASDEILFELQELKKKKPLIISFGDYAASGGYYIAMAADKIYSEPNTITGSIGVFGTLPSAKKLAENHGITNDVVKTNEGADYYSRLNGLNPIGKEMISKSVVGTYQRFVNFVAQGRKKSFNQVDEIGGGRVWSGSRAKSIGLVDELGTLHDAVGFAANKTQLKSYSVKSYPEELSLFDELFMTYDEETISAKILKHQLGEEHYKVFKNISKLKDKNQIMMETEYRVSLK